MQGALHLRLPRQGVHDLVQAQGRLHARQHLAAFDKRFTRPTRTGTASSAAPRPEAKMPRVAESFDETDTAKSGFVTKEQVGKHMRKMGAERRGKQ